MKSLAFLVILSNPIDGPVSEEKISVVGGYGTRRQARIAVKGLIGGGK